MSKKAKLAYAVWPWGLKEKEQLITALKDVGAIGYRYFESVVHTVTLFRDALPEFQSIINDHQVFPVGFYFFNKGDLKQDVDQVERSLDFLAANDIRRINVQAAFKKGGGATDAELRLALETLQAIGRVAKPYGILPCIHPHAHTLVMYEREIDFVLRHTDPSEFGFGPDTAHMVMGGCDPVAVTRRYADRVGVTHLKDVRKETPVVGDGGRAEGFEVFSSFLELGAGEVDIPGFLKVLEEADYEDSLIVELDRAPENNARSAAVNWDYMRQLGYS